MSRKDKSEKRPKITKASRAKAKRIFRYFRPHKLLFSIGFLCLLLSSVTSMLFPELLGRLLGSGNMRISGGGELWELNSINSIFYALIAVFVVQAFFSFFRIYIFNDVTENVLAQIRHDTFSNVVKLPMHFFATRQVGELNSRIAADISLLQETFTTTIAEFIRQFIVIGIGLTVIMIFSWKLTAILLLSIPVAVISAVIFGKAVKKFSNRTQEEIAKSNVIVQESFSGIGNLKGFSNEAHEISRYDKAINIVKAIALKRGLIRASFVSFLVLFMTSTIAFVVWNGARLQSEGVITQEEMIRFIMFTVFIAASFGSLPDLYSKLLKAIGATEHLMDLIDENAEALNANSSKLNFKGSVSFNNINFAYPSRPDIQVLKNISFTVNPGEQVAIVGGSGAGKSTIASLIFRFYDANDGEIRVDDKNYLEYDLSALRNEMAIVPQEVMLFAGTVAENIAYGKPGASLDEIKSAADKANAHNFISEFPEGYNTLVGDRGIQLSGGQRQRIAIARAILKDPKILVLDEATSSLDSESEQLVQAALDELMQGRTSFVIAHRLSTIRKANKILVLHKGELVETGTHDELYNNSEGIYRKLCDYQSLNELG